MTLSSDPRKGDITRANTKTDSERTFRWHSCRNRGMYKMQTWTKTDINLIWFCFYSWEVGRAFICAAIKHNPLRFAATFVFPKKYSLRLSKTQPIKVCHNIVCNIRFVIFLPENKTIRYLQQLFCFSFWND